MKEVKKYKIKTDKRLYFFKLIINLQKNLNYPNIDNCRIKK